MMPMPPQSNVPPYIANGPSADYSSTVPPNAMTYRPSGPPTPNAAPQPDHAYLAAQGIQQVNMGPYGNQMNGSIGPSGMSAGMPGGMMQRTPSFTASNVPSMANGGPTGPMVNGPGPLGGPNVNVNVNANGPMPTDLMGQEMTISALGGPGADGDPSQGGQQQPGGQDPESENLYNSNWCYCCTLINVNSAKLKRRMENKMHAHYPIAAP